MVDDPAPFPVDDTSAVVPISGGVVAVQLEDSDPDPSVVYVPGAGVDGITEAELAEALEPYATREYVDAHSGGGGANPFVDWFTGNGPPGQITGAGAGDMYIDLSSGYLYQLS